LPFALCPTARSYIAINHFSRMRSSAGSEDPPDDAIRRRYLRE
jgi:hypothetical protein